MPTVTGHSAAGPAVTAIVTLPPIATGASPGNGSIGDNTVGSPYAHSNAPMSTVAADAPDVLRATRLLPAKSVVEMTHSLSPASTPGEYGLSAYPSMIGSSVMTSAAFIVIFPETPYGVSYTRFFPRNVTFPMLFAQSLLAPEAEVW